MGRLFKRGTGKHWWADYTDENGNRVRKSTKMSSKQLAFKVLAIWEGDARQIQMGLKLRQSVGSIGDYVTQYQSSLRSAGRSAKHVGDTVDRINATAKFAGFKTLSDVDASGISRYIAHVQQQQDWSHRTIGAIVSAMRSFCRWCVANGYLPADPTASMRKPNVKLDRRHTRRMLLREEWFWVKQSMVAQALELNGQSHVERLLLYRCAIETGLRANELMSLTTSSVKLDDVLPHIICKASTTKNAKLAKQYLSDGLAQDLVAFLRKRSPSALVFRPKDQRALAKTLRQDMSHARKLWLDSDQDAEEDSDFLQSPTSNGEKLDFHALRHTCGAWLVSAGLSLTEVKEIMRHSSIVLTVDHYGHLAPDARSGRRNVLGDLL